MLDSVKLFGEYADAIDSVKDKKTGKEAAAKINQCCDKMEELAATISKLPKINNKADYDKLEAKVTPEMAKILKRATKEKVAGAVVLCGGEESFKKAMERFVGPALNKLQSAQMQMSGR